MELLFIWLLSGGEFDRSNFHCWHKAANATRFYHRLTTVEV
jgi:hypothetical protein